jgi:hypothetical protein
MGAWVGSPGKLGALRVVTEEPNAEEDGDDEEGRLAADGRSVPGT